MVGLDGGPKDVEYASIDFSIMKRKPPRNASKKQESIETEYAEIMKTMGKKETVEVEGEMTEVKEEVVEDEQSKQSVSEEERGDNTEVYSNLKDIMNGI